MKKLLLTGIAALSLATGTAAEVDKMPVYDPDTGVMIPEWPGYSTQPGGPGRVDMWNPGSGRPWWDNGQSAPGPNPPGPENPSGPGANDYSNIPLPAPQPAPPAQALACADSDFTYECGIVSEYPASARDRDKTYKIEIKIEGSACPVAGKGFRVKPEPARMVFDVTHVTVNGNSYSRYDQYYPTEVSAKPVNQLTWKGLYSKDVNTAMIGKLRMGKMTKESEPTSQYIYTEQRYKNGKLISNMKAICYCSDGGEGCGE